MADTKGSDPKPNDGKTADIKTADIKTGAVRPPVLDLTARETGTDTKPETKAPPAKEPPAPPKPSTPPRPDAKPAASPQAQAKSTQGGFAFGAAVTGGVLGLAAAYGLAWFGLWPAAAVTTPAADPRLAQFAAAIPELETVTETTQTEMATLNQRIVALESAEPAPQTAGTTETVDLTGIENNVAALSERLDTLAAAPQTTTDTSALDALRGDLATLTTRLDEVAARIGTAEASLRTLDTTVTETSAALAQQPSDIGAVLQLPLILSGFETAFASGRPYATELGALRAAVPDADIPTVIANGADSGIVRPDVVASRFATVLPAMLAGRPANPDAQWQDGALDWLASAIALRPTGEIEGESPEAVMSRLEGAIARRDFAEAETLLDALPAPMLAAAEDVPALVQSQAEAARFLDSLRASALSGEAAQ